MLLPSKAVTMLNTEQMNLSDLIPALLRKNGRVPQRSGHRLAADLDTVRQALEALRALCTASPISQNEALSERFLALLLELEGEIVGINADEPPSQAYFDALSTRILFITTAMKLMLNQQAIDILEQVRRDGVGAGDPGVPPGLEDPEENDPTTS